GKVHRRTPASYRDADGHPRAPDGGPGAPGRDPPEVLRPVRGGGAVGDPPARTRLAPPAPPDPTKGRPPGGRRARTRIAADPSPVPSPVVRSGGTAAPDPGLYRAGPAAEPADPPEVARPRRRADHPHRPVPDG